MDRGFERRRSAVAWDLDRQCWQDLERNPSRGIEPCSTPVCREPLDGGLAARDARAQHEIRDAGYELRREEDPVVDRQDQVGIDRLERASQAARECHRTIAAHARAGRRVPRQRGQVRLRLEMNRPWTGSVRDRQVAAHHHGGVLRRESKSLDGESLFAIAKQCRTVHVEGLLVPGSAERLDCGRRAAARRVGEVAGAIDRCSQLPGQRRLELQWQSRQIETVDAELDGGGVGRRHANHRVRCHVESFGRRGDVGLLAGHHGVNRDSTEVVLCRSGGHPKAIHDQPDIRRRRTDRACAASDELDIPSHGLSLREGQAHQSQVLGTQVERVRPRDRGGSGQWPTSAHCPQAAACPAGDCRAGFRDPPCSRWPSTIPAPRCTRRDSTPAASWPQPGARVFPTPSRASRDSRTRGRPFD